MHNNNNYYQCKMCWNKALTFGVGSINSVFVPLCSHNTCMQRCFQFKCYYIHFSQIAPRVCTLVLFIFIAVIITMIIIIIIIVVVVSYC